MTPPKEWYSQEDVEVAKTDFRVFLWIIFKFHLADIATDPTPLQYDIAQFLVDKKHPYKLIMAFRGLGKSYIACLYCIWRLWNNIDLSVLVLSASKDKSDQNSTFMLRTISEVPFLVHLMPHKDKLGLARKSKFQFDVAGAVNKQAPSVKSSGILGQITGSRADIILADDIEIPRNSNTPTKRESLFLAVGEFSAIERTGGATEIIFLGTPQSFDTIYNKLPKGEHGYYTRMWPSEYPETEAELRYYGNNLAPSILKKLQENPSLKGAPTDTRFDVNELAKRKAKWGRSGYALHFKLNTVESFALKYPLKMEDLVFFDCDQDMMPEKIVWGTDDSQYIEVESPGFEGDHLYAPAAVIGDWVKYEGKFLVVDPSGRGQDETGYSVIGYGRGYVYLLDCGGLLGGYQHETLTELADIAKKYKVQAVVLEDNFGDGMFGELFRPVLQKVYPGCGLEPFRSTGQKELRIIQTLEPLMNAHKLIVNKTLIEKDKTSQVNTGEEEAPQYRLFYQMTRLTKERKCLAHDDRLDSLAIAVKFLEKSLGRDVDVERATHEQLAWEEYISKHSKHLKGNINEDVGWCS